VFRSRKADSPFYGGFDAFVGCTSEIWWLESLSAADGVELQC
jgi:hypothetical protein